MAAKKASKSTAASKGKAAAKVAPAVKPVATEVVQAPARPLPGLKNMGNTCWLNAVMQALTHCQFLADAVENSEHHSRCAMDKCVLCNMEAHLRCARHSTAPFISPDRIVNTLPLISSTLMRGRQEDAHEFLRTLVCSMQNALTLEGIQSDDTTTAALAAGTTKEQSQSDDEASQVSGFSQRKRAVHAKHNKWGKQQQQQRGEGGGSSVRGGKGIGKAVPEEEGGLTDSDPESESVPQNSSTSSSSSSSATAALSRDRRYPFSLFSGAIQNQVRCGQCKKLSSKQDPIEDLELEISRSSSLENALVQFCAEEELAGDNAYHCDRCKTKVAAMRRIQLHKVPPVLTVSFKRFAVNGPYASGQGGRTSARAAAAAAAAAAAVAPVLSPPPQGSSRGGLWGLFSASKSEGGANNNPAAGGEAAAKSKYDTSNSSSHNGGKMASSRPRGGLQKIQHYVHYPEYLDLTPFCSTREPTTTAATAATGAKRGGKGGVKAAQSAAAASSSSSSSSSPDVQYHSSERYMRLFAVVVHLGSTISSGHYVSYVRSLASPGNVGGAREAGWHRMDDVNVTVCSTEEALNQCAYILFYERCPAPEARAWLHAQSSGTVGSGGLSDINRRYSEQLLASQSKEEKKKADKAQAHAAKKTNAATAPAAAKKAGTGHSSNKPSSKSTGDSAAALYPARTLSLEGEGEEVIVPDSISSSYSSPSTGVDEDEEDTHAGIVRGDDDMEEDDDEEEQQQRRPERQSTGGLLSWLFPSSPQQQPVASPPSTRGSSSSSSSSKSARSQQATAAAEKLPVSPTTTNSSRKGTAAQAAAKVKAAKTKRVQLANRRGGGGGGGGGGGSGDDSRSASPTRRATRAAAGKCSGSEEALVGLGAGAVSATSLRRSKRQRLGPGEGLISAVAEFVGGILFEKD